MQFARLNGVVLHHAIEGPEAAPTLVFSNSLGTDFRIWDRVLAHLDGQYRTVRYDKRGHGLSEVGPEPYSIERHVADLSALLDHLKITRAVVVGLSVGGMIAQGLTDERPDVVAGLVLSDTGHKIGTHDMWDARMAAIQEGGIASLSEAILERWFSARFRAERDEELAGWRAMLTRTPIAGYLGTCAAIRNADFTEVARAISVPTLAICGSEDGATPPDLVRELAELVPGARFELVEGAGHLPCIEFPEIVARLIKEICAEVYHV